MKRIITFQNYAAPKDNAGAPFAHWTNLFIAAAIVVGSGVGIAVVKLNQPTYIIVGALALAVFVASIFSIQFGLLALVFSTYTRLSDVAVHAHNIASVARPLVVLLIMAILIRWAIFVNDLKAGKRLLFCWEYMDSLFSCPCFMQRIQQELFKGYFLIARMQLSP